MMTFFVRSAAALALAVAVVWVQPVQAQEQSVGCDGAVALKAGRSGLCTTLAQQIAALVEDPAVARAHWGIDVEAMDGAPIYSLNEGQLFQPASNAKLFTTATAMALLGPEKTFETRVVAKGVLVAGTLTGDLELVGGGDANLSGRVFPYLAPRERPKPAPPAPDPLRYLAEMADQVVAKGVKVVSGDVVGDDSYFAWEPFGADWAVDDLPWGYGAPVSALSVNDNQIRMTITPGARTGEDAVVTFDPALAYYTVVSRVSTSSAKSKTLLSIERAPGSKVLEVYGSIAVDAAPDTEEMAIADPAEYAAMALKEMLEARGVVVQGTVRVKHWEQHDSGSFLEETRQPMVNFDGLLNRTLQVGCSDAGRPDLQPEETVLATHTSVPMGEDIVLTNKVSQNLHAEILLRNVGKATTCLGTVATGAQTVRQFLLAAGIDKDDFVFFDGSGLSGHDLVTPRATARLLQYAAGQTWFAEWKKSLPVGGVDGSLEGRFAKTLLKGELFAKTGTLGEARALSGYVECASGRTVIFSIMVGNHAPQNNADRDAMDKIVAVIAAAN